MIRIRFSAADLGRLRFAVSPLCEVFGLLAGVARPHGQAPYPAWRRATLQALSAHRPGLLEQLAVPGYLPDLLTPHPTCGAPTLAGELSRVRRTPPERVRAELAAMVHGRPAAGLPGRPLPPAVAALAEQGEQELVDALASELHALWDEVVAPRWAQVRERAHREVARRGAEIVERGAAATLARLHPGVSWTGDALEVRSRFDVDVGWARAVVLVPSVLAPRPVVGVDPVDAEPATLRVPLVVYPLGATGIEPAPVGTGAEPAAPVAGPAAVADLLGATRAALLADLTSPRTTAELAGRACLSAPTVSYHLQVLLRAGLLTRRPGRPGVLYQASELGARLVGDSAVR